MAGSVAPNIITDGLVLYLDAANTKSYPGSGTTWTDIAAGNNGTLTNGPTFNSANGGSIVFDGTNDYYLTTTNILPTGLNPYTLDTWFYQPGPLTFSGSFGSKIGVLFSGNTNNTPEVFLTDNLTGSGAPSTIGIGTYGAPTTPSGGVGFNSSFPTQSWHNITITRDPSYNVNIYKNGVLLGSGSITNSYVSARLYQGGAPAGGSSWSAYVNIRHASTKIYNRALSATEILQNYNATKTRFGLT